MKTISSAMTFIYKFLFPIIWIGGFGFRTLTMIIKSGFTDQAVPFLIITIAGALFLYWGCMRLKVIKMDNDKLYISNYFKEIEVDKNNIAKVTENVLINIHPIWIHFKNPTDFGTKIMFMPTMRSFSFYSSHPIVEELRMFGNIDY